MQKVNERVAQTRMLGDLEVTAVYDGPHAIPFDFVLGVDGADCRRLEGESGDMVTLSVNCFLIKHNGKTILVDAGGGTTMATLGLLPGNLRALAVEPDAIDHILLTHLHRDHSNGLIDANGGAVFPRADVTLHQEEAAFYLDRKFTDADPERWRRGAAEAQRNVAPYGGRMRRVRDGEVFPGIKAVLLPGHTPGHTGYLIEAGGERLLIWGDVIHLQRIQIPRPEAGLAFDVDADMARETRRKTFDWVAKEKLRVAGAHLDFPGFGTMVRDGGGYRYVPEA